MCGSRRPYRRIVVRYYDTSALVKQYLQEAGSKLVLELLKSGEKVYTASLTYAEGHAAFSRRTREGRLTRQTARRLALRFDKDWETYDVVNPGEDVLRLARQMLYRQDRKSTRLNLQSHVNLVCRLLLEKKKKKKKHHSQTTNPVRPSTADYQLPPSIPSNTHLTPRQTPERSHTIRSHL